MYTNEYFKKLNDAKDIVKKLKKLEEQKINPTKSGMIDALSDAKLTAPLEVKAIEISQGDTIPTAWNDFPIHDLQRKLPQYQQALRVHAIALVGKEIFDKLSEE